MYADIRGLHRLLKNGLPTLLLFTATFLYLSRYRELIMFNDYLTTSTRAGLCLPLYPMQLLFYLVTDSWLVKNIYAGPVNGFGSCQTHGPLR